MQSAPSGMPVLLDLEEEDESSFSGSSEEERSRRSSSLLLQQQQAAAGQDGGGGDTAAAAAAAAAAAVGGSGAEDTGAHDTDSGAADDQLADDNEDDTEVEEDEEDEEDVEEEEEVGSLVPMEDLRINKLQVQIKAAMREKEKQERSREAIRLVRAHRPTPWLLLLYHSCTTPAPLYYSLAPLRRWATARCVLLLVSCRCLVADNWVVST
jgi:hypothetical protein